MNPALTRGTSYAVPPLVHPAQAPGVPLRTTAAWHLARRAAQAPTAAIVADINRLGPRAWLDRQLSPSTLTDPTWDGLARAQFPWLTLTSKQLDDVTGRQGYRGAPVLAHSLAVRPLFTTRVLWENVVNLWGDLLYVPYGGKAQHYLIDFDRTVLRKHAFGRYADLLHAAVRHPAILRTLDNDVSSKVNPNENLGRELLELYSVGVGAYTETDVRQSTLLLTGHSVDWDAKAYVYDAGAHHVGPLRVMGFSAANATAAGGATLLRSYTDYLARHPRTAQRIARRLATRFVSDTPSASLVQTLAQTYLSADTAIVPVLRRLFDHPEFWSSVGAKWARPGELLPQMVRASRPSGYASTSYLKDPWAMSAYFWFLSQAGHAPRAWPRVDGYPDTGEAWRSTVATLTTWNKTHSFAWGWGDGPTYPNQVGQTSGDNRPRWDLALRVRAGDNVLATARRITRDLTGYTWRAEDIAPIASWLASYGARPATSSDVLTPDAVSWWLPEAVRLVMASPYAFLR